ncbi:glycosyltransferase [Bacteroidota bacterium]
MPKISVVIITFNEEKNIGRCLESIKDIADDIVIVDSYSTDSTGEIVKEYGARFVQHPFEGHIQQKNWAITQAKYPHVLSLDADEAVSEKLKQSILEVKQRWKYDGYFFNRMTNYCGKWIKYNSWYPSKKLRLWDSRKGKWGGINPHDVYILEKGSTKKHLQGDILHFSYYSISEHIKQIDKFSEIIANSYFIQGYHVNLFQILIHPTWRFIRDYLIKLGFLDGFYGFVVCLNSAHETFLKYAKLRSLWKSYYKNLSGSICFFNSLKPWGGGEKTIFDIVNRLNHNGHNLFLFVNGNGELFKRINEKNIRSYQININNLSFLNIFKIFNIYKVLKREKVHTIFANLSSDIKVAGIAAKLAGVKKIVYRRGTAIPINNTWLNRLIYRKLATSVVANSKETKRCILANNKYLVPEEKIKIIYNGVDLNLYNLNYRIDNLYQKNGKEVIIGNAGRLSAEKGQMYLVEVARKLKDKGLNFKVLIAGIGRMKAKLVKYASERDVIDKIEFLGFVEDMKQFHKSIDIFCLTSLWEGFGYVLIEAMAFEKPVVAFNINSSAEIIDENQSGFLVEKYDIEEYANKVEILIKDKSLREKFGNTGRKKVEKTFNLEKSIDQLEESILTT